jgi:nucleoside-diphosphate-sugar epimerase
MNIFAGKTILITGATGLIGSHLVKKLLEVTNCTIIALGRNMQKLQDVFKDYKNTGTLFLMEGDVSEKMPEFENDFDYIFHAAGPISGEVIRNYPVSVITPNIIGTINCLEYLKNRKKEGHAGKMIVFSSATVYANPMNADCKVSESETSLADSLDAANAPYSESKRMSEVIAKSYFKQYGVEVIIARFSYLYGYSKLAPDTAFYEFVNKSLRGEDLVLNSNCAPRRDNIFVEDAVDGLLCICEKGNAGESYNISSGGDGDNFAAIDEIATTIAESANNLLENARIKVSFRETANERRPGFLLDNKKLKALGWNVNYSLRDGIEKTLKTYIS